MAQTSGMLHSFMGIINARSMGPDQCKTLENELTGLSHWQLTVDVLELGTVRRCTCRKQEVS